MPISNMTSIEGVIWDLDNTLYRFEGDFEQACHIAAARAAVKGGLVDGYEQALALCLQSYEEFGHSYRLFIERYNVDRIRLHHDYHSFVDENLIRGEAELIALFERAPQRHVLLTHASREWAERALARIGLKAFFPEDRIVAAEDTDFQPKSDSRAPFEKALGLLGLPPEKSVVVEDTAANLRIPCAMGMATALVHYGRPPDPMPDYIDADYNNAVAFLKVLTG